MSTAMKREREVRERKILQPELRQVENALIVKSIDRQKYSMLILNYLRIISKFSGVRGPCTSLCPENGIKA
jgi:hypothetical protein